MLFKLPLRQTAGIVTSLLRLAGQTGAVSFYKFEITLPRAPRLLELTCGTTSQPILEITQGQVIKESLIILRYLEQGFADPPIARSDACERAVKNMLVTLEGSLTVAGYTFVMNHDWTRRARFEATMLNHYARLNDFLVQINPAGTSLFDRFGWAEAVFTLLFRRFWFLEYYEGFDLPTGGALCPHVQVARGLS